MERAPIVALGKFDALHCGHRALAERAAAMGGQPWLISFSGMAEVLGTPSGPSRSLFWVNESCLERLSRCIHSAVPLMSSSCTSRSKQPQPLVGHIILVRLSVGWPKRLPLVAPADRAAVLQSWAPSCGGTVPQERRLPFAAVRGLSPEAFVALLAHDLRAAGVVVGRNYRFGYKVPATAFLVCCLQPGHGRQTRGACAFVTHSVAVFEDALRPGMGPCSTYLGSELNACCRVDGTMSTP